MVKPRAGEAGEGVDDATYTGGIVQHDEGVNRVMIQCLAANTNHTLRVSLRQFPEALSHACR